MRIAVSGSTGLIGTALSRSLRADGHDIVRLVRRAPQEARRYESAGRAPAAGGRPPSEVRWDPKGQYVDAAGLVGCDAVVHLAGAGIGDRRWTPAYKKELRDSRVLGTAAIADALASLDEPPRTLIVGTAVGYYGDTGSRPVDESAPPGDDFLANLCQEWEEAAVSAEEAGIRTVFARSGLVVAREGGAWGPLFRIFKAGAGGRLGSGNQYWSHIALHDHIAALRHLLERDDLSGPFNLTAPEPVTNKEATAAMGRVLHRPTIFPVPAPVLRAALGEFSKDVLGSQRVIPRRLLESGFTFAFPGIEDAVRAALR
ncbi:TIGR01777 family protein [Streptomyces bathyalis]|uniref:TIGR01777 family protein n=1 Tax=Streptomyces bathyalis TaxID=2710756 RepID=A0A7T1WU40_9ACTN|nr:TIGR01777 family oxidoreductase [Streptomyces bathyalis]QPP09249.1 TIGR01777 family protein [Streptomyces bathyalis]